MKAAKKPASATIPAELIDRLLAGYEKPGGFARRGRSVHHLGYEKGDPGGRGSGNNRNGATAKTVLTEDGEIEIAAPRDRASSFEPKLIAKGQTGSTASTERSCRAA